MDSGFNLLDSGYRSFKQRVSLGYAKTLKKRLKCFMEVQTSIKKEDARMQSVLRINNHFCLYKGDKENLQPHEKRFQARVSSFEDFLRNLDPEDTWPIHSTHCTIPKIHKPTKQEFTEKCMKPGQKQAQKFPTDDASLPRSGQCFPLAEDLLQPIRSTTQIWEVTRHQYEISAHVPQTFLCRFVENQGMPAFSTSAYWIFELSSVTCII